MLQSTYCHEHEALVARAMQNMASDLRLIDVEYLVSFITLKMDRHVSDHVMSSAERYFTPGFISMGQGCDIKIGWDRLPEIMIDLTMNLDWARIYFSLMLKAEHADIALRYISSFGGHENQDEMTIKIRDGIKLNSM